MADQGISGHGISGPPPAWMRPDAPNTSAALVVASVIAVVAAFGAGAGIPAPHIVGMPFKPGELLRIFELRSLAAGLAIGGFAWMVIYFGLVRPAGRKVGWKYFAALFVSATLAAAAGLVFVGAPNQRSQDLAVVRNFADAYKDRLAIDSHAYAAALAMMGPPPLTPEALRADPQLVKARARVGQARAIIARYQALQTSRRAAARARIGALPLDPAQRQRLVAAFDRGGAASKPAFDAYWARETRLIDILEDMVGELERARGGWTVRGDMVMFTNLTALARLNVDKAKSNALNLEGQDNLYRLNTAPVFLYPPAPPGQGGLFSGLT